MPTTITKTIKSSGGDYTSLSAWEAAMQKDLVTADEISVAECYNFQDTTAVLISGWVTDPTRYIRIYTPTSERHNGTAGTGYRLIVTSAQSLRVRESHVRVEGLETKAVTTGYSGIVVDNDTAMEAAPYILIDACLIHDCGTYGVYLGRCGSSGYPLHLRNTIIYKCGSYGIIATWGNAPAIVEIYNCTVAQATTYGIRKDSSSAVVGVKNCYAGASGTDYSTVSTWDTFTTNASSDTTGTAGLQSIAHSTSSGAYFTNITAGSENYHIGASSALKDVGTDLSATFTNDIDGATRSGTWDIGADEYTTGGSTYNESVTLGTSAGHAYSGNMIFSPSVSFTASGGLGEAGNLTMSDTATLAASGAMAQAGGLSLSETLTLAVSMGITESATLTLIESIVLAVNAAEAQTGAIDMSASVALALSALMSGSYFEADPSTASKAVLDATRVFKAIVDNKQSKAVIAQNSPTKGVKG